jgi:hypothetical protein
MRAIGEHVAPDDVAAIIPTSEQYLSTLTTPDARALFPRATIVSEMSEPWETVEDRLKFYSFLQQKGLAKVPVTVSSQIEDPFQYFGGPFRTRVWESWRGSTRLLRGCTIRTEIDLSRWRTECENSKLSSNEWGFQELLSLAPQHNVSVCGWHSDGEHHYRVTRKNAQRKENGWIIEAIQDPSDLCETTSKVLTALGYRGPFELEFILTRNGTEYKVIELNPRLWLQHRICGAGIVGRCVGLDFDEKRMSKPRFWMDPFRCVLRGEFYRAITLKLLGPTVWAVPGWLCVKIAWRALLVKLK